MCQIHGRPNAEPKSANFPCSAVIYSIRLHKALEHHSSMHMSHAAVDMHCRKTTLQAIQANCMGPLRPELLAFTSSRAVEKWPMARSHKHG